MTQPGDCSKAVPVIFYESNDKTNRKIPFAGLR